MASRRGLRLVTFAAVALGGGLSLAVNLPGAVLDLPMVREYRFFRDGLTALEPDAAYVSFDAPGSPLPPVTERWMAAVKPGWRPIPYERWMAGVRSRRPVYALFDRSCFTDGRCPSDPRSCATPHESDLGLINDRCHAVLASAGWSQVDRLELDVVPYETRVAPFRQPVDLPSFATPVRLAILRLDAPK